MGFRTLITTLVYHMPNITHSVTDNLLTQFIILLCIASDTSSFILHLHVKLFIFSVIDCSVVGNNQSTT